MLEKYKPSSLRGNFERNKYFEGWFQKVYSTEYKASFILIYGYTTHNSNDKFGFLQVLIPNQTPEIVWFGKTFNKHVGHLRFDGQQIDLRELQHFTIFNLIHSPEHQIIQIRSLSVQLDISLEFGSRVMFKGPKDGELSRAILHQTDALIDVSLTWKNSTRRIQMVGNFENVGSV